MPKKKAWSKKPAFQTKAMPTKNASSQKKQQHTKKSGCSKTHHKHRSKCISIKSSTASKYIMQGDHVTNFAVRHPEMFDDHIVPQKQVTSFL